MFEQEFSHVEREADVDRQNIEPVADYSASPRDHVVDPKPSKLGWFSTILLVIVAIVVIGAALGFGYVFLQNRQERGRKRFY